MIRSSVLIVLLLLTLGAAGLSAQQPSSHPGIDLYKQGKTEEAIASLENARNQKEFSEDSEIWNYLGLAYFAKDNAKKAKKAFEKAIKLSPRISAYHSNLAYVLLHLRQINNAQSETEKAIQLDPQNTIAYFVLGTANLWENKFNKADDDALKIIAIDPAYQAAYILRSNILVVRLGKLVSAGREVRDEIDLLKQANDILRAGVEKCKNNPNRKLIEDEAEAMAAFYMYFVKEKPVLTGVIAPPEPGVTPLKIIGKPKPSYTDSARTGGVQGTIMLAVIFAANGRIKHVLVLKRLGSGLDEQAVRVARQIRFEPQTKDGKPVTTIKMVEYTFSIY